MALLANIKVRSKPKETPFQFYESCRKRLRKAVELDERSSYDKALEEYTRVAEHLRNLLRLEHDNKVSREEWSTFMEQVSKTLGLVDERIDALQKKMETKQSPNYEDNKQRVEKRTGMPNNRVNRPPSCLSRSRSNWTSSMEQILARIESDIVSSSPHVLWDDLVGLDTVKMIIHETIVLPSRRPDIFRGLRAPCRGLLLFGPPGNGKTLIAKAAATECQSCFFSISSSSLTGKFFGESESLVRGLFLLAKRRQPSFIFIDEVDSVLSARNEQEHEASRRLKTEFLIQFDGLASSTDDRIFVMAATNRPWDLDEAVRRRFTKRVYIPMPDMASRCHSIKTLLQKGTIRSSLKFSDIEEIASLTEHYSFSDLAAVTREAALIPVRELGSKIMKVQEKKIRPLRKEDFLEALRVIRPSVHSIQLTKYLDWNSQYGITTI
eukprot:jgi/Galph1/996/GphlegSOOS_G5872.1